MNSSDLNKFLLGNLSSKEIEILIEEEVENYSLLMKKKGSSIALNIYEDQEIFIDTKQIKRLLEETLSGNLSNIYFAYICDCLTLGERTRFKNKKIVDIIFDSADPEINGGYKSNEDLKQMLAHLNEGCRTL